MSTDLVSLLRQRADRRGEALAFRFVGDGPDVTCTYAELDARARRVGAALQATTSPGERALLMFPPGLDFITAFFGCLYAGVIAVPVYPPDAHRLKWTLPRLQAVVADCAASCVVTTDASSVSRAELAELADGVASLPWITVEAANRGGAEGWRDGAVGPETVAFLQYTSGSTAAPKGVVLTHANVLANQRVIHAGMGQREDSVCGGWLPPYHDMGLIGLILHSVYLGMPCVLMSPIHFLQRPVRWLEAIHRHRITISGGPNFAYELCTRKTTAEQRAALDLRSWQVAFTGAEAVRPATLDAFSEAFRVSGFVRSAFYPCYGLAEATLMVSGGGRDTMPIVRSFDRAGLQRGRAIDREDQALTGCGAAAPEHEVAIVDPETGAACSDGIIGEIWVRGPSVAQGYWGRAEESAATFGAVVEGLGPYMRTGDLGFLRDGELFVSGRQKEIIVTRGRKLHPQDIEQTVERTFEDRRVGATVAFGVRGPLDAEEEEHLVVIQEIARAHMTHPDAMVSALREAIVDEHQLQLAAICFVRPGTIPKTSSGKLQRRALRASFLAGEVDAFYRWQTKAITSRGTSE